MMLFAVYLYYTNNDKKTKHYENYKKNNQQIIPRAYI